MLHLRTRASLGTGRRIVAASLGALLLALVGATGAHAREARGGYLTVIVQAMPGERATAAEMVRSAGGKVGRPLNVINGFSARVRSSTIESLTRTPSVQAVTPNGRVHADEPQHRQPGNGQRNEL